MSKYTIDMPINIDTLSEKEIADFCDSFGVSAPPEQSIEFIKLVYELMGYDLTNDLLMVLADEPKAQLVEAQAGGGKTSNACIKINKNLIYRLVRGKPLQPDNVLVLVYGAENVSDFKDRFYDVTSKINKYLDTYINVNNPNPLRIGYGINVKTIHSFCYTWVMQQYKDFLGTDGFRMNNAELKNNIVDNCLNIIYKKRKEKLPAKFNVENFCALNDYCIETNKEITYYENTELFQKLNLPTEVVVELQESYNRYKRLFRVFDFSDLLVLYKKLYETNPEFQNRISHCYDYIVADEYQDLTPVMKFVLRTLMNKDNQVVCIGDGDQSIFSFRGSEEDNMLTFREEFEGAKVQTLLVNRRCPRNVLTKAKTIIETIEDRYPKDIKGVKGDGEILFMPYNNRSSQYQSVVNEIINNNYEYKEVIISGRENTTSLGISIELEKRGIPYVDLKNSNPYNYLFTKSIIEIFDMCVSNSDRNQFLNLYKILPISKDELYQILEYDKSTKKFKNPGSGFMRFQDIKFPIEMMQNNVFRISYNFVLGIINQPSRKLGEYFSDFLGLMRKNYWNNVEYYRRTPKEIVDSHQGFLDWFFDPKTSAVNRVKTYYKKVDEVRKNLMEKNGVTLCAFHSLKGLERKHVFLCDLCESIFPNFSGIDARPYDENTKRKLKSEETRLFYVALTRSKQTLHVYYSRSDRSIFIPMIMKDEVDTVSLSESVITFNTAFSEEESIPTKEEVTKVIEEKVTTVIDGDTPISSLRNRRANRLTRLVKDNG